MPLVLALPPSCSVTSGKALGLSFPTHPIKQMPLSLILSYSKAGCLHHVLQSHWSNNL